MKKVLLASIIALSTTTSYAWNSWSFSPCNFYAGVQAGRSISTDVHLQNHFDFVPFDDVFNELVPGNTTWDRDIGSSPVYGFFVGYNLDPTVALEFAYDYRSEFSWRVPVDSGALFPDDPGEVYIANHIKIQTAFLDLKFSPHVNWGGLVPYVKAGVGVAINKLPGIRDVDVPRSDIADLTFDNHISGKSLTQFAWNAGAGVDYYFDRQFSLGLAYRFVDAGKIKSGTTVIDALGGAGFTVAPFKSEHIFLHEVLASASYHFG